MKKLKFGKKIMGVCVVCGGEIKEKIVPLFEHQNVYGPGSKPEDIGESADGLVCTECGIKYEFVPSQK